MRKRANTKVPTAESNRRRAQALAGLRELQLDRERGKVVEVDAATRILAGALAILRSRLIGIGSALAPRLAACTTPAAAKAIVDDAIEQALADLCGYDGVIDLGEVDAAAARIVRERFFRPA